MGAMQPWHWIVVIAIVLLLFGSTRLPGLAKSVGQSMKIFKKEMTDLRDDKSEGTAGNAADNAPGASTRSTTSSDTDSVPGLINNRDRATPTA